MWIPIRDRQDYFGVWDAASDTDGGWAAVQKWDVPEYTAMLPSGYST